MATDVFTISKNSIKWINENPIRITNIGVCIDDTGLFTGLRVEYFDYTWENGKEIKTLECKLIK